MLFEPYQIGPLEVVNRFVRSATYEAMADAKGFVTPALVKLYRGLGRGEIGTIIPGYMFVNAVGRGAPKQMGIHTDETVGGLTELAAAIRAEGSRAIFQLHHAGGQTSVLLSGHLPVAPSRYGRDPLYLSKPRQMSTGDIAQVVDDFAAAARRARAAGADGVQIHAAHGYLLSQFLSPFYNRRTDDYGGSNAKRYRVLGEILAAVRQALGEGRAVLVKMNVTDGTPAPGITLDMAADYAKRLANDGVDGVEISSGSTSWAPFVMCRGDVSVRDFGRAFPWILRPLMSRTIRRMAAQGRFEESYNAPAGPLLKKALGDVPLAVVGGVRSLSSMRRIIDDGAADLLSLSRPFVRQPRLVQQLRSGKAERATCTSCNQCLAAVFNRLPLGCYTKGLP